MAVITVELQCFEPLWDHGNLFEIWVVRFMTPDQEANGDNSVIFSSFRTIMDDAILMSTNDIQFNDIVRQFP